MRRHDREQDQAGRRQYAAGQGGRRARRPEAEALVEQRDADRRREHGIDHGQRGQRRGQPRAPVGGLGEHQPARGQDGYRRQIGPRGAQRAERVRGEGGLLGVLGHRLREHGGHAEGRTGPDRQQHAAQHRPVGPVRGQEQRGHPGPGEDQQQAPLPARQRPVRIRVPARQRQQPGQPHRGQHRPAPGRRTRPAVHEEGRHRQREDDGQRTERLDQAQRAVREGHHVQQGAQAVQPDRTPPAGPAQRRVRAVGGARRDLLLDDRAARVREGGNQAEQDRQRKDTHEFHNARPQGPIPPPTGGHQSYPRHTPEGVQRPRRPPGRALPKVTAPSRTVRRGATGLVPGASDPYSGGFGTSAAGGCGRVSKERQRP